MTIDLATGVPSLPAAARQYLQQKPLEPVWAAARERLERNGLAVTSSPVRVDLDEEGQQLLAGVVGTPVTSQPGKGVSVRIDLLDAALRRSAANAGVVGVLTALSGPLVDRRAARAEKATQTADLWSHVETALASVSLAGAPWVSEFLGDLRRGGLLTRAGERAATVITEACAVLAVLGETVPLARSVEDLRAALPAPARFELGELATRCTGTAHGLDAGTPAAALVLRAVAVASGQPLPTTAAAVRLLWASVGVAADEVSGTVLVWGIRPSGDDAWSQMMRDRADLGLVTHVTLQEWRQAAGAVHWADAGSIVHVCENPQVLQAAARAAVRSPLLCLSGNPATVALAVTDALVAGGVAVRYHGDFDVEGVKITSRLIGRGVTSWRMGADDYREAVALVGVDGGLPLSASVVATPWDPDLARAMNCTRVAVHEEALLDVLLSDLRELTN